MIQVSLSVVAESVGHIKEVHFILFGQDTMDAFLEAAKKQFGAEASKPEL